MRLAIFVLVLLLGTAASARALPDAAEAGAPPTTKVSLALADQDVVADIESALASNGRIPNTGGAPQQRTADLQFQLPLAPDQRWVLWMARDPVDMVRVTGLDGTIQTKGFFYAALLTLLIASLVLYPALPAWPAAAKRHDGPLRWR